MENFNKIIHFQLTFSKMLRKLFNKFRLQPWGRAGSHQSPQEMGFFDSGMVVPVRLKRG